MNDKNNIEDFIKAKLANQNFEVPSEFTSDLNARLDAKFGANKNKGGWIWFSLFFLALVVISTLLFYPKLNGSSHIIANEISDSTLNYNSSKYVSKSDAIQISKEQIKQAEKEVISDSVASSIIEYKSIGYTKNKTDNTVKHNSNTLAKTKSKDEVSNDVKASTKSDKPDSSKVDGLEAMNSFATTSSESHEQNNTNDQFNKQTASTKNELKDLDELNKSFDSIQNQQPQIVDVLQPDTSKKVNDSIVIRDSVIIKDSIVLKDSVVIRDSVRPIKNKWEVELNGGVAKIVSKNYSETEQSPISPLFGFGVNYSISKFQVNSGLRFIQTGEKYSYNKETSTTEDSVYVDGYTVSYVYDSVNSTWDTIYNPIYDSTQVTKYNSENISGQNTYSWIRIPIGLSYRIEKGNWAFLPGVGVNIGFLTGNNSGVYFDSSASVITNKIQDRFKLSYYFKLQIQRDLKNGIYLHFQPIWSDELKGERKYNSLGLQVGIGIKL